MGHYDDVAKDLRQPTRELRAAIPDTWGAFAGLHGAAMDDGELPRSTKEVIALTIAAVKRCDGCISYHARAAAKAGATRGAVAEALGVALLMDGGTASVYGPRALAAFDEFADATSG
jgi:AhpD family alkylhydroperoxidase